MSAVLASGLTADQVTTFPPTATSASAMNAHLLPTDGRSALVRPQDKLLTLPAAALERSSAQY